jgi:molybdopterin-guanine dinucleotide biosynthesis protein A
MGSDKGLLPFLGVPLVRRIAGRVRPLSDDIALITNAPDAYAFLGMPMIGDDAPGLGPLGGLRAALARSRAPIVAVIGCDMPFVSVELLRHCCDELAAHGCDAAVPASVDGLEPLHAAYRAATCLPAADLAIARRELRMGDFLGSVQAHVVAPEEWMAFDPHGLAFQNVNTPDEFAAAEAHARSLS